jgi:hypothetical protein
MEQIQHFVAHLLAADTENGIHIVVTHICALSRLILRIHGERELVEH